MKRLIAYFSLIGTILLTALVFLVPSFSKVNGTGDYESQHTYIYKISDKTYDISNDPTSNESTLNDEDMQDRLDDTVDEFKARLSNADISDYTIKTIGLDTISVTFKVENDLYDDVSSYLNFSWSLKASTYSGDPSVGQDANEVVNNNGNDNFFDSGSARIEYKDNYPYVVVTLKNPEDFKTVYVAAKDTSESDSSSINNSNGVSLFDDSTDEEDEEEELSNENKIYILNDWVDGLTIDSLLNESNSFLKTSQIKNYLLFTFNATEPSSFYYDYDSTLSTTDQENAVYEEIYFGGYNLSSDSNSNYYGDTESDRILSYKKANIWMNKFNSSTYDYSVTLINENGNYNTSKLDSPSYDYLVFMNEINWTNGLFISFIIGSLVVLLFSILNYGLNGLSSFSLTFSLFIASIGLFNLFGSEFNIGAIIGLVTLIGISLFTSLFLFKKVKDEVYSGKQLKKAYQDASKKSVGVQIDISALTLIIGIISYLMPSSILVSFGSLLIVGSLLNIALNVIILRPLTWLLSNSTTINSNIKLISIDKTKVPDLTKEEKPTYFNQFKKKESKNTKKFTLIVGSILLLASITMMTVSGIIRGTIYNSSTTEENSAVTIRVDSHNVVDDDETVIENYIQEIKEVFTTRLFKDEDTPLFNSEDDVVVEDYNYSYIINDVTNKEYYFIVSLDGVYENNSTIYQLNSNNILEEVTIDEALNTQILNQFQANSIKLSKVYNVNSDVNNLNVLYFGLIAVAISTLYILLRYGLSKSISSLLIVGSSLTITVGIFSLLNASFSSIITLGILYLIMFSYMTLLSYYSLNKELLKEKRNEMIVLENRYEEFEYSNNNMFTNILTITILSSFPIISLFFSTSVNKYLLILILLGEIIMLILSNNLSLSIEEKCGYKIHEIHNDFKNKRIEKQNKNKNKNKKAYNDGPEEAIFIGIND